MTLADALPQVIIMWIILLIVMDLILSRLDKKKWNNGICPQCGKPWRFESHYKGGRMYVCENHHSCRIGYGQDNW